jgi:tetratricopeptide (TPR) repeat protein
LATLLQARALRADDAAIHNALAGAYTAINDVDRARAAARRACELAPDWAPCWFNHGWRLFMDGDLDAAVPALQRAVALAPRDAQARALLADALNAEGKPDQAAEHYRRVIAGHPHGAGAAWWGLATLKPTPLDADDIAAMRGILDGGRANAVDRITIGFALALALEQQGEFAAAFAGTHWRDARSPMTPTPSPGASTQRSRRFRRHRSRPRRARKSSSSSACRVRVRP